MDIVCNDHLVMIVCNKQRLQIICSQLELKFKIITTSSFSDGALEYLKDNPIDCIIIGLTIGNTEMVRRLLYYCKLKYPHIPIVILVGNVDLEMIRIVGRLGVDKVISFNCLRTLARIINEIVPNSSSRVRLSDFNLPSMIQSVIVKRALHLIESEYIDLKSVQEIADHIGVSNSALVNDFRKNNLISPKKFLMHFKVNHAVNLMKQYELSITTIARLSGFTNSKRFIECFRRVHPGYSPFQFKALFIKKKDSSISCSKIAFL